VVNVIERGGRKRNGDGKSRKLETQKMKRGKGIGRETR